jgi:cell wall-associated NlpC family hydrolase
MHPAERFVGLAYSEDFDCADFVAHVLRELHGKHLHIPNGRPRGHAGQLALGELSRQYVDETTTPTDGDVVLMKRRAGVSHVGLYYFIGGEAWVLHSNETSAMSVLHRVSDLPMWGARIVGVYRCR